MLLSLSPRSSARHPGPIGRSGSGSWGVGFAAVYGSNDGVGLHDRHVPAADLLGGGRVILVSEFFFKWYYPLGERGEGVAGDVDSLLALPWLPQRVLDPRLSGGRGQEGGWGCWGAYLPFFGSQGFQVRNLCAKGNFAAEVS